MKEVGHTLQKGVYGMKSRVKKVIYRALAIMLALFAFISVEKNIHFMQWRIEKNIIL